MPRACTICAHPAHVDIDRALLRGDGTPSIAVRFRVQPDALLRHRTNHLERIAVNRDSKDRRKAPLPLPVQQHRVEVQEIMVRKLADVVGLAEWCITEAQRIGAEAENAEDYSTAMRKVHEVTAVLKMLPKWQEVARGAELAKREDAREVRELSDEELERRLDALRRRLTG